MFGVTLAAFVLGGCASTVTTRFADGREQTIKAGFGNRLATQEGVAVEPSEIVVSAGERLGSLVVSRASDAIIQRAVDNATVPQN